MRHPDDIEFTYKVNENVIIKSRAIRTPKEGYVTSLIAIHQGRATINLTSEHVQEMINVLENIYVNAVNAKEIR